MPLVAKLKRLVENVEDREALNRQAILAVRALTDPVWQFILFWLPKYLTDVHGQTLEQVATQAVVVLAVFSCAEVVRTASSNDASTRPPQRSVSVRARSTSGS